MLAFLNYRQDPLYYDPSLTRDLKMLHFCKGLTPIVPSENGIPELAIVLNKL